MQFLGRHLAHQTTIHHGKLIIWVLLLGYSAGVVAAAGTPSPLAQFLAFAGILIAFAHAVLAYGRSLAFVFLGLCLLVTFSMENLGIATGFPFGRYHFEVASNLPHIGAVPIIVGPLYFAMGYFSWIIASILLGQADLKLDRAFYRLALPIVAAFVMVQWDVVMDPPNATLGHAWVWHDGGGYFGVPLSNFLGWYLTVWLFYQAFALVLGRFGLQRISRHRPLDHDDFGLNQSKIIVIDSNKLERDEEKREPAFRRNQVYADCVNLPAYPALCREFLLIPILLYFSVALSLAVPYFTENTREIVDIAGTKWNAHNLRETAAIIALFTMVFTSVLALIRLVEETPSRHSQ